VHQRYRRQTDLRQQSPERDVFSGKNLKANGMPKQTKMTAVVKILTVGGLNIFTGLTDITRLNIYFRDVLWCVTNPLLSVPSCRWLQVACF